jgi:pyruvate formate lyase activating enzyme
VGWIKGFVGLSLIEYPGKVAAVVFTGGCPFRCPFCHNRDLVLNPSSLPSFPEEDVLSRLQSRIGFCDGVSISGGEPLMQPRLEPFIRRLKEMGLLVKLDTNGYYPDSLERLLRDGLLDFVSMDLKTSVRKYRQACGVHVDWWPVERAVSLLNRSVVAHEFRTTLVRGLVNIEDIPEMALVLGNTSPWVLQSFRPQSTLDPEFSQVLPYNEEETAQMLRLAQSLKRNVSARCDFDPAEKKFNQKTISISA